MKPRRRRRSSRVNLRTASIQALERLLPSAKSRLQQAEAEYATRVPSNPDAPQLELRKVELELGQIERGLEEIERKRQRIFQDPRYKSSLLRSLVSFPLTSEGQSQLNELSSEAYTLGERRHQLLEIQSRLRYFDRVVAKRRSWVMSLERALTERRRRKASLENLKAAAASNNTAHRALAASIKRQLARSCLCPYCGGPLGDVPHADHIYPIAKGGRSVTRNMVWVCSDCNQMKKDLTLSAFIRQFGLPRSEIEQRLLDLGKDV